MTSETPETPETGGPGLASPRPNPRNRTRATRTGPATGAGRRRGRTYYTSDWHLGHTRIIELCGRPFRVGGEPDVAAMNQAIIDGANQVVGKRDHLIILGDIVMGKLDENLPLLAQLRAGRITLIPGNHDRWSLAYPHRIGSGVGVGHGPGAGLPVRAAWKKRYEEQRRGIFCMTDQEPSAWEAWNVGGGQVNAVLSHYPYRGESQEGREDRYQWLRPEDRGFPLIHGHVHEKWRINGRMFNVGVDVNGFEPVSEETLAMWALDLRDRERERAWSQRRRA